MVKVELDDVLKHVDALHVHFVTELRQRRQAVGAGVGAKEELRQHLKGTTKNV